MTTTVEVPLAPYPSLARYRKLVFQIAGLVAAVLGALIDATTNGGIVTGVTWLLAVGALLQVALTYWPGSWAVKFAASLLGVAFSGLAAGLTDGFSNAEIMLLAWQVTMWLASGAVDNAPQPLPNVDPKLGEPLERAPGSRVYDAEQDGLS